MEPVTNKDVGIKLIAVGAVMLEHDVTQEEALSGKFDGQLLHMMQQHGLSLERAQEFLE